MVGNALGLVSFLLVASLAGGQSLGELAKKEKKRREKNQEQNVAVRVVNEGEVSVPEAEDPVEAENNSVENTGTSISPGEGEGTEGNASVSDRAKEEAKWRSRLSEVRARLKTARERSEFLGGLHLSAGEQYVDRNNNPVITSLSQLRRMTVDAEDSLDEANRAMEELREEARHAGVPPGWLR